MTKLDRTLQNWRIAKARRFIPPSARVLDIGCAEGDLFKQISTIARDSIGIDPTLKAEARANGVRLVPGYFPQGLPETRPFDVITMLAVLEHFPAAAYADLSSGCARFLRPGGRLIITVPSPIVDQVLKVLKFFRLIHGMSLEEHHGFQVRETREIFGEPAFRLLIYRRFQLGMNNLFVFERSGASQSD